MEKLSCVKCEHKRVCKHYDALARFTNGNVKNLKTQLQILEICGTNCQEYFSTAESYDKETKK